ncbi:chromosome segregation protein SMC [Roseibium sp. RKSG952]|uniref:chromosome segregation protein SMC n=1 Tax=Roseibium sp. RKSG952 TaxID=2529384 RepID=UPI0012BD27EB|nr:chromosome segregation protein SMC [Roseibium sp. RKSG952]MTH96025.1 chromosome segregation protein SMC [Roseibium sp. RKSG952]
MRFSKLRVVGFKSFVEPMEFVIGNGLTGVVGPNGCGKSNLVEALRWVMGENSYKNMRASGMDDVIFSGSLNRPARNTAEVTLFLDNQDRTAPSAFNDADMLEVSRRIERESGSNYKINAKDVRARDVQLLFADASTGARSPAMVRQGQIGELISAKPTARRQILEEAAGISGLHSRRHEAEIRLRGAEQNLERLEDILSQIDGQLDSLRRQARQATRYRNLSGDIRAAEAAILYLRWSDAQNALQAARTQFAEAEHELREATRLQSETARVQAIAAHKLPGLRDAAAASAAALQRLVIARNGIDSEERRVRERIQDLDRRLAQLSEDVDREQRLVLENDDVLERLTDERAELLEENVTVQERGEAAREKLGEAEETVARLERALADQSAARASALAESRQLEQRLSEARQRAERLSAQADTARAALMHVEAELSDADGVTARTEALEIAEERLLEAEAAVEAAELEVGEARVHQEQTRKPLFEAQQILSGMETEARTLETILSAGQAGEWPSLVDQIEVTPGFEMALGAALGEEIDAPLSGEAPMRWAGAEISDQDPVLPGKATCLAELVKAPGALARRLSQIGLVEAADGAVLQKDLCPGQRLVSRQGDLWRWDGFVISADAPTPAAQRLAQKNRLNEVRSGIAGAQDKVAACNQALEGAVERLTAAAETEQTARAHVRDRQHEVANERKALAAAEKAASHLLAKKQAASERSAGLTEDAAEAREILAEIEERVEEAPRADSLDKVIEQLTVDMSGARSVVAEARAVSEGLLRDQHVRDRRLEAIAREYDSWKTRASGAKAQIEVLKARQQEAEDERAELIEAPEDLEIKRRDLLSAISRAEGDKKQQDDALQSAESSLVELDRAAKAALEVMSEAREKKVRAEERLQAARDRKRSLEGRIDENLGVPVSGLAELAGIKDGAPLPDVEATERKLERLKAERERLGGVNLRAEEELREVDEQKTTLTTERDDLIEAIRRLRTGISNLNREARERLMAAFDVVNGHFQRLFTHLFGGGMAELQLVDSEDPLQAGLEILARPPGKKPQTMTLLSGGEQALTAMSLIFAVFLTNPAPICVLDEVDAPLDDANVERYCDLLEEMARNTETRFVVITHNPITMARMNRLFGVTMAERGVSQLVSVDLETAESYREAV